MPEISDSFPAPALDATKWNESSDGGVTLTINNRVEPVVVDAISKAVSIDSQELFSVPGVTSFDMSILYNDVQWVADLSIVHFFGWRTHRLDEHNNPWAGADILLVAKDATALFFHRRSWVNGLEQRTLLAQNDAVTTGGFRLAREGLLYILYYLAGGVWVELERLDLQTQEPGFVIFGQFAEDPELEEPWIGSS